MERKKIIWTMTLTKQRLTDRLADKTKMTKEEIYVFLGFVIEEFRDSVFKGETITLSGFGNFQVKKRKNLRRGVMAKYKNDEWTVVKFQLSREFYHELNPK